MKENVLLNYSWGTFQIQEDLEVSSTANSVTMVFSLAKSEKPSIYANVSNLLNGTIPNTIQIQSLTSTSNMNVMINYSTLAGFTYTYSSDEGTVTMNLTFE